MKIDHKLNLVQPIEVEGGMCYVHSVPLLRQVWESYYLVLAKTYAAILSEGLNVLVGPTVAKMMLREIAMASGRWTGPQGVEQGLLPEIRRQTNVLVPTGAGWDTLPFDEVIRRNLIDEDSLADAEGIMIFFICTSAVLRAPAMRPKLLTLLGGMETVWGRQTTSLDVMEYGASLQKLTPVDASPEVVKVPRPSSIVY